jgi:hypothetical protein
MKSNSRPADAATSGGSDRRPPRLRGSELRTTATQSAAPLRERGVDGLPARRVLEDGKRWEGTVAGLYADGSEFTACVAMALRRSETGMPIGFVVSSSDAMEGVALTVELHRTRAYTQSALECVPHALVIVSAVDEMRPANVEDEILSGYSHEGTGWSPVDVLIADRYLDRLGFASGSFLSRIPARRDANVLSQTGPTTARAMCASGSDLSGAANWYARWD